MSIIPRLLPHLIPPAVVALAVAVISHLVTLYFIPYVAMSRAFAGPAQQVGWNSPLSPPRPSAQSRAIVRPSPDLLYTICAYDVSQTPVEVAAPVPKGTYWSVALYSDNTDNYFVVNDKQAGPLGLVDFVIYLDGTKPPVGDLPKIKAPTRTGLVLFRTLINDERKLGELEAARKETKCAPFAPEPVMVDVPTPQPKPTATEPSTLPPTQPEPTPPANERTGQN